MVSSSTHQVHFEHVTYLGDVDLITLPELQYDISSACLISKSLYLTEKAMVILNSVYSNCMHSSVF